MQDFTIFPNYFFVIYLHFIIKSNGFIASLPFIVPLFIVFFCRSLQASSSSFSDIDFFLCNLSLFL